MTECCVLLVTWFLGAAPPQSYQVTFNSTAACVKAQGELQQEEARLHADCNADLVAKGSRAQTSCGPILSTVCVRR
jgi:hypothetical protein